MHFYFKELVDKLIGYKTKNNKTQKLHKVPLTEHAGLHSITGFTGNCTQVWLQTNYYVSVIISASTAASKSEGRVLQRTQTLNWDPTRVLNCVGVSLQSHLGNL